MANLRSLFTRKLPRGFVTLVLVFLPLTPYTVYADDPASCVPPPASTSFHYPNGASSGTFVYNCDSGLFENAHYTYDPTTGVRTAKDPIVYTCDPATRTYNVTLWGYNAPSNTYVPYTQNVTQPPAGANVVDCPPLPAADPSINNTGAGSNNTIGGSGVTGGNSIDNTGANSNNTIDGQANNNLNLDNTNNLLAANNLNTQATSGNSMLIANTTAGNASSGNAQDVATIVNMLQSASNGLGSGNVVTFVDNVNGDVNGDLLFDPSTLGAVQPASTPASGNNNLTINNQTNAAINNNINVGATSGDVTVSKNTTAGNATSGSAQAVANVVNMINSAIASGKSFIGTININGNLNGDILIPPTLIDQLIASNVPTVTITNTGANSNNTVNSSGSNNTNVTNTNNQGITNNVKAGATSGTATANQNTTAGNVGSGNANTSITAFNLTGSNVLGNNDILVFVNVLGKWVGMIVNAPQGATVAELGGGINNISNTGANSNNAINNGPGNSNTNVNNNTNQTITNNINANARSGNATANQNTTVGNVGSGNAKTAVNLMNFQNSTFSLSNWFGILFINVFGTWNGSFGVNTSAGDPVTSPGSAPATASSANGTTIPQVFRFVPKGGSGGNHFALAAVTNTGSGSSNSSQASVLAAAHKITGPVNNQAQVKPRSMAQTAAIIFTCVGLFILADAFYTRRHNAKKAHTPAA